MWTKKWKADLMSRLLSFRVVDFSSAPGLHCHNYMELRAQISRTGIITSFSCLFFPSPCFTFHCRLSQFQVEICHQGLMQLHAAVCECAAAFVSLCSCYFLLFNCCSSSCEQVFWLSFLGFLLDLVKSTRGFVLSLEVSFVKSVKRMC